MPVSESCTVEQSRMSERDASASIAMTASGCTARTVPRSVSIASMPVRPKTPGVSTLTEQNAENAPFCRRWRVTSTCSALLGPMASGVIFALPSPATSTLFTFSPSSALSSAPTARDARSSMSSAFFCSGERSSVTYRPRGLPSWRAAPSVSMRTLVTLHPRRKTVRLSTPESVCARLLAQSSSCASMARSVRYWSILPLSFY